METLLDLMNQDTRLSIPHTYMQELHLWMHMKGLYSINVSEGPQNRSNDDFQAGTLNTWQTIPPMVSVTPWIPRSILGPFITKTIEIGFAPPLHSVIQSSA